MWPPAGKNGSIFTMMCLEACCIVVDMKTTQVHPIQASDVHFVAVVGDNTMD